jgi:hypothetical protein
MSAELRHPYTRNNCAGPSETGGINRTRFWGLLLAVAGCTLAHAGQPAADLRTRYLALQDQLNHNAFQRPLFLDSTETTQSLKGDIFAVIAQPFATVRQSLQGIEQWCDILILHPNVKGCRAVSTPPTQTLKMSFGRKHEEPLDQAYPVDFDYRLASVDDTYLQVLLRADTGPMVSRNYRIELEAVPLPGGQTFIHLSYAYEYGFVARLAMKGYLATLGSGKVGFSIVDRQPDGAAVLITGVRGVVERNTMRYYLAIEAYVGSLSVPPPDRLEKRLHDWFAATERFRRQLHELDETAYLAMKRKEVLRQQSATQPTPPA